MEVYRGSLTAPTGEQVSMTIKRRRSGAFDRFFVQLFPAQMAELAADRTASTACLPVYMQLLNQLRFDNFAMISQAEIAKKLHIGQTTVSLAVRNLLDRGYLERQGSGPRQQWKITPLGAWCGTAASYNAEQRERTRDKSADIVQLHTSRCPNTGEMFDPETGEITD